MSLGGGQSKSKSGTTETVLSKEQADILKQREAQYQEIFFPALKMELQESGQPAKLAAVAQPAVQAINSSYKTAGEQINKNLQRRGLAESGFAPQADVQLQTARIGSLAEAYARATEEQRQRRLQLIQMGGSMSPTPTSAAPMGQYSKGSSWNLSGEFKPVQ